MNIPLLIKKSLSLILFLGALIGIGYFTPRASFTQLMGLYTVAFTMFIWAYFLIQKGQIKFKFWHIIALAVLTRLVLIIAAPELSNDFYRFIWDGELLTQGINPYAHTPNELISFNGFYDSQYMRALYHGMGELSQNHYSCYPVFNQLLFLPGAKLSNDIFGNILVLRVIIILADILAIVFARKILLSLNLPADKVWLFALNPFIILEFTGNLHFEGVMIAFLLIAVYYLIHFKWLIGAFFMAIAIQVKLTPLLLLPLFFKKLKWRWSVGFTATTFLITILIGMLLLNPVYLSNMFNSVNEYFVKFEFNASIYYLSRELGYLATGWNIIQFIGPALSILAMIGILCLALFKRFESNKDILVGILFAYAIYYGFATTVHPWYISLLLIFSIFTNYRFPLLWSFLVFLSYSAYGPNGFKENLIFVTLEYSLVIGFMIYEIRKNTTRQDIKMQLNSFFKESSE